MKSLKGTCCCCTVSGLRNCQIARNATISTTHSRSVLCGCFTGPRTFSRNLGPRGESCHHHRYPSIGSPSGTASSFERTLDRRPIAALDKSSLDRFYGGDAPQRGLSTWSASFRTGQLVPPYKLRTKKPYAALRMQPQGF